MKYTVNSLLWSRQHNQYFQPGETVEFQPNPLPNEAGEYPPEAVVVDVDLLVSMGVITPVTDAPPADESKRRTKKEGE